MWADDAYWLPQILSSEKNDILGAFVFENKSILSSYSIHVLPSCSYSSSLERFLSPLSLSLKKVFDLLF